MQDRPIGFSLSALSIRRHIGTLMLTLAVVVLGIFALSSLQVDLLPSITYPRIGVRLDAPGISPEVAIDEITRPLEEALSATEGVIQVYSQTREGQVSLDLYFQPGGNIDQALNDATATFNRARGQLPDTIEEPRLFKVDPSQLPVYEMALTSPSLPAVDLRVFADEELARELGVVSGVAAVDVSGGVNEEVRVTVDLDRLQASGVGLNTLLTELSDRNQDISGGRVLGENSEPLTRAVGRFRSAEELRDLAFEVGNPGTGDQGAGVGGQSEAATIAPTPARRVYLRDFADVVDGTEEQRIFVSLNGQPAVKVSVQKQPDANTIEVVEGVKRRIEELRQAGVIPADMQLLPTLDESTFIQTALDSVMDAAISGGLLAAFAVLVFLGSLRQTLIISLTIPLCTLAAAIAMRVSGFSLNVFSLAGLAISIGQAVDTSVVILENINNRVEDIQHTQNGSGRRFSTRSAMNLVEDSSREVESSMVAATGANLVSVFPFIMIGGFIALLFNELILTICFAVAASLLVAVTVVPMLSSRLLTLPSSNLNRTWLFRTFNNRFDAATRGYASSLVWVLRHRVLVLVLAFGILGTSSLWMLGSVPQEILPRISTGQANLNAQFPPGMPLRDSRRIMDEVDKILRAQPETEYVFTTVGGFLFGTNTNANPLRSSSNVTLKPGTDVEAFVTKVTKEFRKLNLVDVRLRLSPGQVRGLITNNSPVRGAEVDVILQGETEGTLNEAGREVLQALEEKATLTAFRPDAEDRQPEIQIRPDLERLADLNLNVGDIGESLQTAIEGTIPTQIQRGNRLVDVRVRLDRDQISQPSQIAQIPLFTSSNRLVRLGDVAQLEESRAPGEIRRINQRQVFLIAGNLNEGASLGDAINQVNEIVQGIDLPEGVSLLPSASAESNRQLQQTLPILGGLAAFLVFVVMAVQYNSLVDPLVIMFTLPLALAGGIFGLFITKTAIGATVIVGAVLLVGIVVNNAIIMVELANQIREEDGCDRRTAILNAAPQRLRPILMTTVTTVLGIFPLALGLGQGGEFLQPLGIVVFSGLSLATLLTLFVIPCFYLLLHDLFGWRLKRKREVHPIEDDIPVLTEPKQEVGSRE
ncbi:MAG: efflux RND transporter permease subunit [Leptolyngbyaceae cyanobacterium bins.302]|nr:efflux RND transporter permease subunit [Leptolyngbyaceae cyanobacterium bins.302]